MQRILMQLPNREIRRLLLICFEDPRRHRLRGELQLEVHRRAASN